MGLAKREEENKKSTSEYEGLFDAKDPSGTVKELERRVKYCLKKDRDWQEVAKEDYRFALGDQWTPEEKEKLEAEDRPCLTFNKIEPLLDLVGGWERENSFRIKVFPEGGEDRVFGEIGDKCLKAVNKWTKLNYRMDHQFDDGLVCGRGWIEMAINYDDDPIHGDLKFSNPSVYQVLVDPDSKEYDLSDADYAIKLTKMTKKKLRKLFPTAKKKIEKLSNETAGYLIAGEDVLKEGDKDNYHLGKTYKFLQGGVMGQGEFEEEEKYLLKEYWHREYVTKYFVYDVKNARMEQFDTEEEAEAFRQQLVQEHEQQHQQALEEHNLARQASMAGQMATGQVADLPPEPEYEELEIEVVPRSVCQMMYAASAGGELLQKPVRSPLSPFWEEFPFFPFYAKRYVSAEDDSFAIKGIVRNVKDPQKELNKSRSQFLHILNTSANSGWIGDKNALTQNGWKDLEKMGSTPGVIVRKKPGTELSRIDPSGVSHGQLVRSEEGTQDIKEISGVNADAMAVQDKTTSGKAISLRIRQAMTILSKYFRNFKYTKEIVGTAVYAMIPHIFDTHMIKKLCGEEWLAKNNVSEGHIDAFLGQIKDGKYNIEITEADNSATLRQETFDNLMDMASNGMPIPPDVILEFSSIPNSKEIIDRVREYVENSQKGEEK